MFFFFSFFENKSIYNYPMIRNAFRIVCVKKLLDEGYCDLSLLINLGSSKSKIFSLLENENSIFKVLFNANTMFPKNENSLIVELDEFMRNHRIQVDYDLTLLEANSLLYWVLSTRDSESSFSDEIKLIKNKNRLLVEIIADHINENYIDDLNDNIYAGNFIDDLELKDGILWIKSRVSLSIINSKNLFNKLKEILIPSQTANRKRFYRGHSDMNYALIPSIMRKESWIKNENIMYNQLIRCNSVD